MLHSDLLTAASVASQDVTFRLVNCSISSESGCYILGAENRKNHTKEQMRLPLPNENSMIIINFVR